jgi:hypothetical protein
MSTTRLFGTGMKTITTVEYNPDDPADLQALIEYGDHYLKMGRTKWDRVATYYKEILENAGLVPIGIEGREYTLEEISAWKGIEENHLEASAAEYLKIYHYLQIKLESLKAGILKEHEWQFLFDDLFEMGQIYERQFWRSGIDPISGKVREELAIGKRNQEKAIPRATEARRIHAQDTKPDWHDNAKLDALEIRRIHPTYSRWRIAGEIHERFGVSRDRCDKVLRANGIE